ncbi:MAG: GNAT family N-acetyltransferase [Ktedonobacteraceae bacterium]|nr:GNAT family N-acetyltransferase [Ktedonobacteraceae bacterium]
MPRIEVRPARAEDREAILAFTTHTWEWGDYIEDVWDEWLHDAHGCLFVATVDGRPAGLVHMHMLSEGEAWMEGLRVDPQYRGLGLARELNLAAQAEAMRRGATLARLLIDSRNERSKHLAESNHMRRVGAYALYTAPPLGIAERQRHAQEQERTQIATPDDLNEIIDYLNVSNIFPLTGGLYYAGYTGYTITARLLEARIADRGIYLLCRWGRLDGLAIAEVRDEYDGKCLSTGYIDGTTIEAISLIAHDLRRRLGELELERVRLHAPDLVLVRDMLPGLAYTWDGSVFCTYERGLV